MYCCYLSQQHLVHNKQQPFRSPRVQTLRHARTRLAVAPPYPVPRMGVSTSRKPRPSRKRRSSRKTAERTRNISRRSGLPKRSKWRRRKRLSTFSSVVLGFGIIRRHGDSAVTRDAEMDSSPASVLHVVAKILFEHWELVRASESNHNLIN